MVYEYETIGKYFNGTGDLVTVTSTASSDVTLSDVYPYRLNEDLNGAWEENWRKSSIPIPGAYIGGGRIPALPTVDDYQKELALLNQRLREIREIEEREKRKKSSPAPQRNEFMEELENA